MTETQLTIDGKAFEAKLSVEAVERIEAQFDDMGLHQILKEKQSLRMARAVLLACINAGDPSHQDAAINAAITQHAEKNGVNSLLEMMMEVVNASGLFDRKKAQAKK